MTRVQPLRLKGAPGSPYTRKMLAYMRYRHIEYELLISDQSADQLGLPEPKTDLLPTFYLPNQDGEIEAVVDSTPLIRRFEQAFTGRETLPEHPMYIVSKGRADSMFTSRSLSRMQIPHYIAIEPQDLDSYDKQ